MNNILCYMSLPLLLAWFAVAVAWKTLAYEIWQLIRRRRNHV